MPHLLITTSWILPINLTLGKCDVERILPLDALCGSYGAEEDIQLVYNAAGELKPVVMNTDCNEIIKFYW